MSKPPLLLHSPLTNNWYIVTSYKEKTAANGTPYIDAQRKFDVTDRVKTIIEADPVRKAMYEALNARREFEEHHLACDCQSPVLCPGCANRLDEADRLQAAALQRAEGRE